MLNNKLKYYLVNKPYGVLTQFTDPDGRKTLKDLFDFPKDVYPIGRLDLDSEGLLLLSNDKSIVDYLLNPAHGHEREYYAQVEGIPNEDDLKKFEDGILIKGIKTLPAKTKLISDPGFPERIPPIRERRNIPTSWISITLNEGKFHQVRKMTAAIGYPTLRLVRVRIKELKLGDMPPGAVRELTAVEIESLRS
ncbi:MAG: pseudouridine synthase [bacterium]